MSLAFLQGLAGAMGGLSRGLDDVREQKRLAALEFRNKQQLEMQAQQQEFQQVKAAMDQLQVGDTVDPELASRASRFGLNAGIEKDPITGSLRRKSRLEDELNQTRLADAKTQGKLHEMQLGITMSKSQALGRIQELGPKGLLALPKAEREYMYSMAEIDDVPMTPEEELQQARLKGIPGQMQAQAYGANQQQSGGVDILKLYDQARENLMAIGGERVKIQGIPESAIQAEMARLLGMASGANKSGSPIMQPGQTQQPAQRRWSNVTVVKP